MPLLWLLVTGERECAVSVVRLHQLPPNCSRERDTILVCAAAPESSPLHPVVFETGRSLTKQKPLATATTDCKSTNPNPPFEEEAKGSLSCRPTDPAELALFTLPWFILLPETVSHYAQID